jgi:hypothetical protein
MPIKPIGIYSPIEKAFVVSNSEQGSVSFRRGADAMALRTRSPIARVGCNSGCAFEPLAIEKHDKST